MPVGQRVVSVKARCLKCHVPAYFPLDDNQFYKVFTVHFLVMGGKGFSFETLEHMKYSKSLFRNIRTYQIAFPNRLYIF